MHWFWLLSLPAAAYQCLALSAEIGFLLRRARSGSRVLVSVPPVSVLKPLRGIDPNTYPAFVSQIQQNYAAEFEVIFGASDVDDPALDAVRRLMEEYPKAPIRIVVGRKRAPNGKVGLLEDLSDAARFPYRVVNDSDIKVTPEYLARVTAPLADPKVGVVTCPYRVRPHNLAAGWEGLGIATDFMPSALVAQTVGVREFGFGSTLAFRADDLEAAGGFGAIADYLADDYQLAKRITGLGKRAVLSTYVVETSLGDATWVGIWRHQVRWGRTIRFSKGGYAGLPITHAGVWAVLALALGAWPVALGLVGLRMVSALVAGALVVRSAEAGAFFWLTPVWDLYSFAVWAASYAGNTVRWRDRVLRIDSEGRIRDVG